MLVSYNWLCEIAGFAPDPSELSDRLTFSGLEVDDLRHMGNDLDGIVVGEIKSREKHPSRDKLHVVTVDSGVSVVPVVCGAPNCPGPGAKVILATVGATVGGVVIEPRELAGTTSQGMLCSEAELDIGPDSDGIMILDGETEAPVGTPIAEALGLEDWVYELGVTPNRPDALSHRGIAREMALLFGRPFEPRVPSRAPEGGPPAADMVSVDLEDALGCPRYACAVMGGIEIKPSPFGYRYRLHNLGVRPISNLVDVTNLILLEWGQPLHAFDLTRVRGSRIVIRRAATGEKMRTLDELERTFVSEDILICDGEGPVAVAGVMGGLDTGIGEDTSTVLIECAYFDPASIRRTSKRLKLSSESSYRFERGVDPNMTAVVLDATTGLIQELAGGARNPGIVDRYPRPITPVRVKLRPSRFEKVMGYCVTPEEMTRILEGIGSRVEVAGDELMVEVPTGRPDIEREIDLIEEVARVSGLEKIPTVLPRIQSRLPERQEFEAARRVKEVLTAAGLDEAITYSFVPESSLMQLGAAHGAVRIANPLNSERATMRTTLLAGLLENLKRAATRYESLFRQFEVGRVFFDEGGQLPRETLLVAGLMSGPRDKWVGEDPGKIDYYDAKGTVEMFVRELCGREAVFTPAGDVPGFHPKRTTRVIVDGVDVGAVGELSPEALTVQKLSWGAVGFELDVLKLWGLRAPAFAAPLSDYPPMSRDVAFLVDEEQDAGPLREALERECGALATEVCVFDVYRGKGIPEGKKSMAFSVTYRSWERTLTDEEVDTLHRNAIGKVMELFSVATR